MAGVNKYFKLLQEVAERTARDPEAAAKWLGDITGDATEKYITKGVYGATAFVAGASVLDVGLRKADKKRAEKQEELQEDRVKRKTKKELKDRYAGLTNPKNHEGVVQRMFDGRIGHSNSWGGRQY